MTYVRLAAFVLAALVCPAAGTAGEAAATAPRPSSPAERVELLPIPRPPLDEMEESVREQWRDASAAVDELIAAGEANPRELADAYGDVGRLAMAYDLTEAASAAFANARTLVAGDFRWAYYSGVLGQWVGRLEEARWSLEAARELRPGYLPTQLRLAEVEAVLGHEREARRLYQDILAAQPDHPAAHYGLGGLAAASGDAAAAEHYRRALEIAPESARVHRALALALKRGGRVDAAIQEYREAVRLEPEDPLNHTDLALILAETGAHAEALTQFRAALDLAPDSRDAELGLAMTLARLGREKESLEHLENLLRLDPHNLSARSQMANLLLRLGRRDEAVSALEAVIAADPNRAAARFNLAMLLAWRGQVDRALEEHLAVAGLPEAGDSIRARALGAGPGGCPARSSRAISRRRRAGRVARILYAVDAAPVHGELVAMALAEEGRFEEALSWQRRAVAVAGSAPGEGALRRREAYASGRPIRAPWRDDPFLVALPGPASVLMGNSR